MILQRDLMINLFFSSLFCFKLHFYFILLHFVRNIDLLFRGEMPCVAYSVPCFTIQHYLSPTLAPSVASLLAPSLDYV